MTETARLVDQQTDGRWRFMALGADYGSDAKLLAVKGLARLVWARPTRVLIGAIGCGHVESPTTLQLRTFRATSDGMGYEYASEDTLLSGGRLSRSRLLSVQARIDEVFGPSTTARLDPQKTLLIGEDVIAAWLDARERRIAEDRVRNPLCNLAQVLAGEKF